MSTKRSRRDGDGNEEKEKERPEQKINTGFVKWQPYEYPDIDDKVLEMVAQMAQHSIFPVNVEQIPTIINNINSNSSFVHSFQ